MLSIERLVGLLVLVKAVDLAARGPTELPAALWAVGLGLWVTGGVGLLARPAPARLWWGALVLAGAAMALDYPLELRRQHLVLLVAVALVALVARDERERLLLWRVQLTALYGVAALAKLNESFLGGDVLAQAVVAAPLGTGLLPPPPPVLLVLAGLGLIATEATLAITPWVPRLRQPGTALAAAFHGATLLLVTTTPLVGLRLVVFGGTSVVLHAVSAGLVPASALSAPRRAPAGRPARG